MTDSEVKAFKNEMRNYKFYQKRIEHLTEQENMIYHQLGGYKSPDPSKIPGSFNPNLNMYKADLSDRLETIGRHKQGYLDRIASLDRVLDQVDPEIKKHIMDIYVAEKSYQKVADEIPIVVSGLYKRINTALKRVKLVMPI